MLGSTMTRAEKTGIDDSRDGVSWVGAYVMSQSREGWGLAV